MMSGCDDEIEPQVQKLLGLRLSLVFCIPLEIRLRSQQCCHFDVVLLGIYRIRVLFLSTKELILSSGVLATGTS